MKENNVDSSPNLRNQIKKFISPALIGAAMALSPITIDNNYNIDIRPNIAHSEKETPLMMYDKLASEYPRMYNSNYAITPNEAIQKNDANETIATNGMSITHKYIEETGKWEKLDENLPWSTPEERIKNTLNSILNMTYSLNNSDKSQGVISNPLRIDKAEVQTYLNTKSDIGLKTFQIINNAKGEPALVLATNPVSRLSEHNKSIEGIKKAFDFLNKVDPSIVDKMTHQYYVRAISGDINGVNLKKLAFDSTYRDSINTILVNGDSINDNYILGSLSLLFQSRNIYLSKNIRKVGGVEINITRDRANEDIRLDKFNWTRQWLDDNKGNMSTVEFGKLYALLNKTIAYFKTTNNIK